MALDVSDVARSRDNALGGQQDTEIVKKMMVIAGGALMLLVAIKLGFLKRVLP